MSVKNRLKRTAILAMLGLVIGVGAGFYQVKFQKALVMKQGEQDSGATKIAGLKLGGPFTLVNQDGEKVTEADFKGQYALLYFGFTYCPAICPTELQKISRTLKMLERSDPQIAERIQPLFITVDPDRDTPAVLKDYISLFHPRLVGLTGTQPQIDLIKRNYRIFATKVEQEESNDYTMDHSSFIYLMDPQGELISLYRMNDRAQTIVADIQTIMADNPVATR